MAGPSMYDMIERQARFREDPVVPEQQQQQDTQVPVVESSLPPEPAAAEPQVVQVEGIKSGPQPVRVPTREEQDAVQAAQAEENDPEMVKLESAYEAVKEDLMTNSKKITDEKKMG